MKNRTIVFAFAFITLFASGCSSKPVQWDPSSNLVSEPISEKQAHQAAKETIQKLKVSECGKALLASQPYEDFRAHGFLPFLFDTKDEEIGKKPKLYLVDPEGRVRPDVNLVCN